MLPTCSDASCTTCSSAHHLLHGPPDYTTCTTPCSDGVHMVLEMVYISKVVFSGGAVNTPILGATC